MRVPANDGTKARLTSVEIKFVEVVDDVEKGMCDFNDFELGKGLCPFSLIHIAPHGYHGRYCPQAIKYVWLTYVPGMNNQIGVLQRF